MNKKQHPCKCVRVDEDKPLENSTEVPNLLVNSFIISMESTSGDTSCWNLLESTPARIPLIKSSHKWTRMLFLISNSKLGFRLCSQPGIDLNSQSNFYDVLTRPYKYLIQHSINTIYKNNMHSIQSFNYLSAVFVP